MSFVAHVECTVCGHRHDAKSVLSVCERCGQMLAVRYDLERVRASVTKDALRARPPGMYRFRELTPLDDGEEPVTLGEGGTPLLALPRLAAHFGLRHLWGKNEGQNPTGSFKARGLGMAITKARGLGARGFLIPSAGNAGGAAAVYAARCGLACAVIVPRGTPPAAIAEAAIAGATVFTIEGSIATAGKVVAAVAPQIGWFDLSTLKEPYRLEGIWTAPESAALVAALTALKARGDVGRDTEVMLILTGCGLKYEPPPLAAPVDLAGGEEEILAQVRRVLRP